MNSKERGNREGAYMFGTARLPSLGQRALKGSTGLGSLCPGAYLWLADIGCCFAEYTKQKGSTWLKIYFIRAIFRKTGCVKI